MPRDDGKQLRVLVTGATGFIGSYVVAALLQRNAQVTCAARSIPANPHPALHYINADFSVDHSPEVWAARLDGIDVVINAVGIIRETDSQTFQDLHCKAPQALFEACLQTQVHYIIQISALGADEHAASLYHLTKREADEFLIRNNVSATILQPSLVYGREGGSAKLFNTLASLPVLVLPDHGKQMVQPVHVDDLVATIMVLLQRHPGRFAQRIAVVGPAAMSVSAYIACLRNAMGMKPAWEIGVPMHWAKWLVNVAGNMLKLPMDCHMLDMLEKGNQASAAEVVGLLGRQPRAPERFIDPLEANAVREEAKLTWLLPVLRASLALVWIVTGLLSLGIYPVAASYALLERAGIPATMAPLMLYGAAVFDILIGVAIFLVRRKWIWKLQAFAIIFYSLVIAWKLPEFLLHPYGPILKNVVLLGAIWILHELEKK